MLVWRRRALLIATWDLSIRGGLSIDRNHPSLSLTERIPPSDDYTVK